MGLFYEITSIGECTNLPSWTHKQIAEFATDSCVILHEESDCESGLRVKMDPGTHSFWKHVQSVRPCSAGEGGPSLIVDLYSEPNYQKQIAHYDNLCECIDLPEKLGWPKSVDNHGNCVELFDSKGCTGERRYSLEGGRTLLSEDQNMWMFDIRAKSIRPCGLPPACKKLHGTIVKFQVVTNHSQAHLVEAIRRVDMCPKSIIRNNGSTPMTHEYNHKKIISEKISGTRASSTGNLHGVDSSSATLEMGEELMFAETIASNYLLAAYSWEDGSNLVEKAKAREFTFTTEKSFSLSGKVEIPPCTEAQIKSSIHVVERVKVEYEIVMRLSGMIGDRKMTAKELQEDVALENMKFHGENELEEECLYAKESAVVYLDTVGLEQGMQVDHMKIEGCIV